MGCAIQMFQLAVAEGGADRACDGRKHSSYANRRDTSMG